MPRVFCCVIVNYNTTQLALEAARSFLEDGGDQVVIVDNASKKDSFKKFLEYKQSLLASAGASTAACPKPSLNISPDDFVIGRVDEPPKKIARLTVLASQENRGFAAGCNIGLRFLEEVAMPTHILLLNPDASIARGSLDAFFDALNPSDVGLCGATILEFDPPHRIQALGGARLSRLLHLGANIGDGEYSWLGADNAESEDIDYPHGAAMAFKSSFVKKAGHLDERYFLYFEEADWARSGLPLKTVWAREAIVYHRYGASTGSKRTGPSEKSERSALSDLHMARSRLLFALKWRPATAPLVLAATIVQSIRRLAGGRYANAIAVLDGVLSVFAGKGRDGGHTPNEWSG